MCILIVERVITKLTCYKKTDIYYKKYEFLLEYKSNNFINN